MLPLVLFIILQLCSVHMMTEAKPTCHLLGSVIRSAHNHLNDLVFPVYCLKYNANISFPESAFPAAAANHAQCRRALSLMYETLRGAELVFQEHDIPTGDKLTWTETKLDIFQNLQDRLLQEGKCFSSVESSNILSSYFSNITTTLQQQESATCGWMVLWRDLREVLKVTLQNYTNCLIWGRAH